MIAVLFEVQIAEGRKADYLKVASDLLPVLQQIDGFISVERFQSLSDPQKLLSLSVFRDETAVATWRALSEHRAGQESGRSGIFADYRLRVASVIRDYGMDDREQAPTDSRDRLG